MDHPQGVLRTGDRATVQFEFISHPEFVKEGMKLLFREGKTKVWFSLLRTAILNSFTANVFLRDLE
jgi:GTPase